jgi:hypothetical protein
MNEGLVALGLRTGGAHCLIRWWIHVDEAVSEFVRRGYGVNGRSGGLRR